MAGLNKVTLIGYLGGDPEIYTFENGGRIASFSLATTETWKDKKSGDRKEQTQWHNITLRSDRLIAIAEKYLKKGGRVYVEGRLETRSYKDKKDGSTRYIAEVVLRTSDGKLLMLDGAKKETTEAPPLPEADAGQLEPGAWEPDDATA